MSDTGKLVDQRQDSALREGLRQFSRLPDWMIAARDPEKVAAALKQIVPEFNSEKMNLIECDIGHIRFKNDFWSGLYELLVSGPGDPEPWRINLQSQIHPPGMLPFDKTFVEGELGKEGWRAVIPELHLILATQEPETVLSALEFLTDPEMSREYLERSIRADTPSYRDIKIATCKPKVVRYKPGSRCTILYRLGYAQDGSDGRSWPDIVVAKTYRGEKGQNAYDSMLALFRSPLGSSSTVTVAEPLAYDPERRVLVQGPIREEQTLKELIISAVSSGSPEELATLNEFMRKTAAGLAQLHLSEVRMGSTWVWENEVAEVQDRVDRLSAALPSLIDAAAPLIERLNQLAATVPADPLVPTHGSFRPAQVLLYKGKIGFIDFDSFSQSEPANDLALFLSTVMSLGLTTADFDAVKDTGQAMDDATRMARFERMSAISSAFLDEYERHLPVSRVRVALWEALDIFMLVLHGWIKIKVVELDDIMYLMERFLQVNEFVGTR